MIAWLFFFLIVALVALHFMTTDRMTDGSSGESSPDYLRFLNRQRDPGKVTDIPAPPGGVRDTEVERLLQSGNHKEARRLLAMRLDEARNAPIGRDAKIAQVNHYIMFLEDR